MKASKAAKAAASEKSSANQATKGSVNMAACENGGIMA